MQSGVIRSWPFHIVLRREFRVWFVVSFCIILKHSERGSVMDSNIEKYSKSEPELMEPIKKYTMNKVNNVKKSSFLADVWFNFSARNSKILRGLLNICIISSSEILPDWPNGGTGGNNLLFLLEKDSFKSVKVFKDIIPSGQEMIITKIFY